jgi:flagellar FliJ protein
MKRYNFRLERILELRRHRERLWEMKLAEITGQCVRLENHIQDLQNEKDEHSGFEAAGVYSATDVLVRQAFRSRLEHEMHETGRQLEEASRKREEVNHSYLEAARERKVLDKLKERKAEEYYEEQRRKEEKTMNETAVVRAVLAGRDNEEGGE